MKIALVSLSADPSRGGAEKYTVQLAQGLAALGHEVILISAAGKRGGPQDQTTGDFRHVVLPAGGFTRAGRYRSFVRAFEAWRATEPCDVVHAMLPLPHCDVYHPHAGIAAAAVVGKPVQTLTNPRRRLFARVERELLGSSNPPFILCLSNYVRDEFLRYYPDFPVAKLSRLFNAVDLDRFQPRPEKAAGSGVEALIVAQDFVRKGLATVIRALPAVPEIGLTVVGHDKPEKFEQLATRLGVSSRVHFAGGQKDVRPFYANADFFVLPTRHDPCSLVVLEALASGLPVVSTRFNGACEIMEQGKHGFVLDDAEDAKALAEAMRSLINPDVRHSMSMECIDLRPALSFDFHLQTLVEIYKRVGEKWGK